MLPIAPASAPAQGIEHHGGGNRHDGKSQPDQDFGGLAAAVFAHDLFVPGDQGDQQDQGNGGHAVKDGGKDQGPDRVDADEIDEQADQGGNGDNAVKAVGFFKFQVQPLFHVKSFGSGSIPATEESEFVKYEVEGDAYLEMKYPLRNIVFEKIKQDESLTDKELLTSLLRDGEDVSMRDLNKVLMQLEILGLVTCRWQTKDTRRIELVKGGALTRVPHE